ncbi:MAG: hypothetical protein DI528_22125 [Shinella sp.]|nr:MAG: hypothetical protein DI528_22125 [Shinella sp.]
MRILPFPTKNARKLANPIADWSQQEIADFYRAHRLLAENGAAIGIDRGVSDIGEPWLVFFDLTSQDVFLHVARIDGCCHLICDPLNLRLSAASIPSLVMEFETSVRAYLSIRSDHAKNVVIHPAARIIMSISAIFLLFKLENNEAQAKGLSDKTSSGANDASGPVRLIDKSGTALARAQNAFARAFDAVDAPANAALLAGVILAGELAIASDPKTMDTDKTVSLPQHEQQPVLQALEGSEQHKMIAQQIETAAHRHAAEQNQAPAEGLHGEKAQQQKTHLSVPTTMTQIDVRHVENAPGDMIAPPNTAARELAKLEIATAVSAPMARTNAPEPEASSSNGLKSLANETIKTGGVLLTETKTVPVAVMPVALPVETKTHTIVSLETLGNIAANAGFNLATAYDDAKSYALKEYLTQKMGGQFTFEYQSGKLLIEQTDVESLKASDMGVWTNVSADHSTMTVVGKAALIDDVLTFFS